MAVASTADAAAATTTRALILDTARRLFEEQGYAATSLRQIAESVGMTKAAVYYHYAAKDDLLLELTRPFLDGLSRLVTELRSSPARSSEDVLGTYLDLFIDNIDVVGLLGRDPATQHHPDIGHRVRGLVAAIQQQLAGSDSSTTRTIATACAMGVVHATPQIPTEILREQRHVVLAAAIRALDAGD